MRVNILKLAFQVDLQPENSVARRECYLVGKEQGVFSAVVVWLGCLCWETKWEPKCHLEKELPGGKKKELAKKGINLIKNSSADWFSFKKGILTKIN